MSPAAVPPVAIVRHLSPLAFGSSDMSEDSERNAVELKNPLWAAGLALLIPGLGHLYQGRYAKGLLFMFCILPTFFLGWSLGGGKVVYAEFRPVRGFSDLFEQRWHYVGQFWVGLPAWPALVQTVFNEPLGEDFMTAPEPPFQANEGGEEADWIERAPEYYELGTVYTLIAGILNLLVIFDAAGGPILPLRKEEEDDEVAKQGESGAVGGGKGKSPGEARVGGATTTAKGASRA
ncbi:MAG: hypothetical protein DWQ42_09395 [Planctomycetota bacterium]|nr:MAG: hypothetical protein DWQ42_09395 [Planctomycetota bacterium]REK45848.1 MAG: hypothetical protein DWQ46_08110 [Planctomycetota bacterium]